MNFSEFLDLVISSSDVIAFGETHHGTHNIVFQKLAEKLDKISGLLLEYPVNYQSSLEQYFKTGKLDDKLNSLIKGALKEGKDLKEDLSLWKNISQRVPIFCTDSSKEKMGNYQNESFLGHYFLRGKSRDGDMFTRLMEARGTHDGKICVIGGSQHVKYGIHFRFGDTTLGKRLKDQFGDKFFNVCLWSLPDEDILKEEIHCFDVRDGKMDPLLETLMKKYQASIYDENNNLYYDGYIVHGS